MDNGKVFIWMNLLGFEQTDLDRGVDRFLEQTGFKPDGVFAFVLCLFGCEWEFAMMRNLSPNWTNDYGGNGGGGMSAAPIYLGLMALAGTWLVKDSIQYLFKK